MVKTRLAQELVEIPGDVDVTIDYNTVCVKGSLGEVRRDFSHARVRLRLENGRVVVEAHWPDKKRAATVGTIRSHIQNMMTGVVKGFTVKLKIVFAHFPVSVKIQDDRVIIENFQGERLVAAILGTQGAYYAMMDAIEYGQQRVAFGKPIIKFQVWRHCFAEMATKIEASRRLTYYCCDLFNRELECSKEISMAKLFAGEVASWVIDRCLQFHGGYGYMAEYDISRAFRDMRLLTIGGGTSEVMKEIIWRTMGL